MGHQQDLPKALVDLAAELASMRNVPRPTSADEFEVTRTRGRKELLATAQDLAKIVGPLLERYHNVKVKLGECKSNNISHSVTDIKHQLQALTADGFWTETPWKWLAQYPRATYKRFLSG